MDFESIPKISGIYKITNIISEEFYIGCSKNLQERCRVHIINSRMKNPPNIFYKEIKKIGVDNFKFEILEIVEDLCDLYKIEYNWIKKLNPYYNIMIGGKISPAWEHLFVRNKSNRLVKPKTLQKEIDAISKSKAQILSVDKKPKIQNIICYTVEEVCGILKINLLEINHLLNNGYLKYFKIGRQIRITNLAINELEEKQKSKTN